ncbi:hypothetical protein BJX64DRAFT_14751 [Aspergillus heterothallicus]
MLHPRSSLRQRTLSCSRLAPFHVAAACCSFISSDSWPRQHIIPNIFLPLSFFVVVPYALLLELPLVSSFIHSLLVYHIATQYLTLVHTI